MPLIPFREVGMDAMRMRARALLGRCRYGKKAIENN